MADGLSSLPIGPIVETLATTYLGDGDVTVDTESVSTRRHGCQDDEQLSQACPPTSHTWEIETFRIRTYAFIEALGYVSQSFEVRVHADTDGCDVYGAFVYASEYEETAIGRDESWRVNAVAIDSPYRRPSGCPDCCPRCSSVGLSVTVSAPGFHRSYLVRVYGDGTMTRKRLG